MDAGEWKKTFMAEVTPTPFVPWSTPSATRGNEAQLGVGARGRRRRQPPTSAAERGTRSPERRDALVDEVAQTAPVDCPRAVEHL